MMWKSSPTINLYLLIHLWRKWHICPICEGFVAPRIMAVRDFLDEVGDLNGDMKWKKIFV